MGDDEFRRKAERVDCRSRPMVRASVDKRGDFLNQLHYFHGNYDDPESYQASRGASGRTRSRKVSLAGIVCSIWPRLPTCIRTSSSSWVAPDLAKPKNGESWTRIIIEKPFGHDGASARDLNAKVLEVFEESQVYRIDHYLGKETVQNLAGLPLRQRHFRAAVEPQFHRLTCRSPPRNRWASSGARRFTNRPGALRDMIQSHVLQLTSLVGDGIAGAIRRHCGAQRKNQSSAIDPAV